MFPGLFVEVLGLEVLGEEGGEFVEAILFEEELDEHLSGKVISGAGFPFGTPLVFE